MWDEFNTKLSHGYQTVIGESSSILSEGEFFNPVSTNFIDTAAAFL